MKGQAPDHSSGRRRPRTRRDAAAAGGDSARQGRALDFVAPTWRVDVEREEDLVEEVARHYGYERIATELPASSFAGVSASAASSTSNGAPLRIWA